MDIFRNKYERVLATDNNEKYSCSICGKHKVALFCARLKNKRLWVCYECKDIVNAVNGIDKCECKHCTCDGKRQPFHAVGDVYKREGGVECTHG